MKRYAKYKDSGVAWIGEVPSDWNVNRLGYLGTLSAGGVDKKTVEGETLVPRFCSVSCRAASRKNGKS